jgi:hypothetical protein
MKFRLGDFVYVKWCDAFRPEGAVWQIWEETTDDEAMCESAGWITALGAKVVVISGHIFKNGRTSHGSGSLAIPRSMIVFSKKLR